VNEVARLSDKLVFALANAMLIIGLVLTESVRRIFLPRWLLLFGAASYSVYLVHIEVITFGSKLFNRWGVGSQIMPNWVWQSAMMGFIFAAAIIGVVCHRFLEQPLLDLSRRWVAQISPDRSI
jgi:exopolysaccharide production protein ExoZ